MTDTLKKKTLEFFPLKNLILIKKEGSKTCLKMNENNLIPQEVYLSQLGQEIETYKVRHEVDAIFGLISLFEKSYFITVKTSKKVAQILNHNIYKAVEFEFIAIQKKVYIENVKIQSEEAEKDDQKFIKLLSGFLNQGNFYYSETYNLTQSFQNFSSTDFKYNHSDLHYFVNKFYLKNFIDSQINYTQFISVFILGYIEQNQAQLRRQSSIFSFGLISRKSVYRLGSRYYSRGADTLGNVSNFVETEQIVQMRSLNPEQSIQIFSYVQIRGSIPFLWTQYPTLQYNPKIIIEKDLQKNYLAYKQHFSKLMQKYKSIQCVNLVNRKYPEGKLGEMFQKLHEQYSSDDPEIYGQQVDLLWFDYHHECKGLKLENLQKLIDATLQKINDFGYFQAEFKQDDLSQYFIKQIQHGVVRNNCKDCLDRTNVAQGIYGRRVLHQILNQLQVQTNLKDLQAFNNIEIEQMFRNIWTDNADRMSVMYSGTPALKTDFTRTGKRGIKGMINDGNNSIQRYFYNNFLDYETQNIYDFFTNTINLKNHKTYESDQGKKFLKNVLILIMLPIIIKFLFMLMGRRLNFNVLLVLTITISLSIYFYLHEKKNTFLKGTILKEI